MSCAVFYLYAPQWALLSARSGGADLCEVLGLVQHEVGQHHGHAAALALEAMHQHLAAPRGRVVDQVAHRFEEAANVLRLSVLGLERSQGSCLQSQQPQANST
jgi:hypothetical protein